MKNRRYSDRDYHLWPFTLSLSSYSSWGVMIDSGAHEDGPGDCHIRFYFGGVTLICELPPILTDHVTRHSAAGSWDAATVSRLGRDWYDIHKPREFGFSVSDGAMHVHYGPQTFDSSTTKSRCIFLPWCHWRFIRNSHYDLDGEHFHTDFECARSSFCATQAVEEKCPKVQFDFDDYDGERITATTHIEEREWQFGTGWCSWLSWFVPRKVQRTLELNFDKEIGTAKGSWKGGTMGTGIEMLPGELHEQAFRRWCEQEQRSREGNFRVAFVAKLPQPQPANFYGELAVGGTPASI